MITLFRAERSRRSSSVALRHTNSSCTYGSSLGAQSNIKQWQLIGPFAAMSMQEGRPSFMRGFEEFLLSKSNAVLAALNPKPEQTKGRQKNGQEKDAAVAPPAEPPSPGEKGAGQQVARIQEEGQSARRQALAQQVAEWKKDPHWDDEPPELEVLVPKDAFIELNCHFTVALPPDAVFDIICSPENRRVFKGIKEVKSRRVLEDTGEFQRVEVEQAAIWRFLWMSGTFDICVEVAQDRPAYHVAFKLAKKGFMEQFEGYWHIEPLTVAGSGKGSKRALRRGEGMGETEGPDEGESALLLSDVHLKQVIKPSMVPPPPLAGYVRGISATTTKQLVADLREEARRIREGRVLEGILLLPDSEAKQLAGGEEGGDGRKEWEGRGKCGLRTARRTRARRKPL